MKRRVQLVGEIGLCVLAVLFSGRTVAMEREQDYRIQPVPVKNIQIGEGFWRERIETNRKVTIPYSLGKCEETGRIDNFAIAGGLKRGTHCGHYFNDSDVFKVIEGASYSLQLCPDADLEKYIDEIIAKIAAAQEDDGYLYTARTIDPKNVPKHSGNQRWSNLRFSHELYNLGHLYEAAVAHYDATGKHSLLNVATKSADLLARTFGPDKKRNIPGHEEVEIGLVKLYRVTGKKTYLELAKFFINERGHYNGRESYKDFRQDHKPVAEQDEAVGHAVSGAYLYSGMADVAALTRETDYVGVLERIWQDVVSKKLYITGVAAARGEKFGRAYELPNLKGYNETCAAIALAMWNCRMFLLHGDGKYMDLVERSLYNGIISGVSLKGDEFFYSNPLESDGKYKFNGIDVPDDHLTASRLPWFTCACCPSNIARFIPAITSYAYAVSGNDVYVSLFVAGDAGIKTAGNTVGLSVDTHYPLEGVVRIKVEPETAGEFAINLRIPGWARNEPVPSGLYRYAEHSKEPVVMKVNARTVGLDIEKGYARIRRSWKKGDVIELVLPMPVRRVLCNEKVKENVGKVALERGPVVYCVEWFDNGGRLSNIRVSDDEEFDVTYTNGLGGLNVIKAGSNGFLATPYYAWAHRGEGEMAVWLPRQASATKFTDRTRKVRHGMTVTRPAGTWSEALPVGNGSVGAMAYGDARQETILLNHEALFYPLWAKPEHVPNMAQYLPEVRRLISEGKYKEAESYWNSKLADHDYGLQRAPFTNPYHPAFDLVLRRKADAQVESEPVKGYREQLDFEKAEATATWREGDIEYERLMFVSRTDDVLVVRVRGSKAGSVTTHIGLAPHEPVEDIWPKYMGSSKEYLLGRKAYTDEPITYKTRARGAWLTLSGKYWDGRQFGGVGRVVAKGGRQEVVGKHIAVKNADEVLVILKLFTNEKRGRQAIKQLRSEIGAMTAEYESLLETHVKEHKELLSRITLDLNAGEDRELSNKELLEKARNGEIPASLVERLFEYGRYLLICSSRPGGLPANLQGVWSGTWTPAWACDYTINENVQMAYWQALPGNMAEVTEPYFDYFDSLIPDWQVNARRFWGCRGIASYLRASDHGLMVQWAPWQFWTAGPGWLAQLYYDYYLYTGDREFLEKRAAPFMKEVALFYEDFVVEGADGKYMFSPSMSPENRPSNTRCRTTVNATMDIAVAKEVLGNLAEACRALGIEPEGVERWEKMLRKFPEYIIGPDGALKEWTAGDLDDSHGHRHMSQIYPLFPGFELDSDEGDAAVREGCRVVLEKKFDRRGDFAAWSCAHQANGFARLGDGQKAVESLRRVALTCGARNLLSFYRPEKDVFQLDAHGGFSSAVLEMLLYSRPGVIKLLPALPKYWARGKVENMLARGGLEVGIDWDMEAGKMEVKLKARTAQSVTIRFPRSVRSLTASENGAVEVNKSDKGPSYKVVSLWAGKEVALIAELESEASLPTAVVWAKAEIENSNWQDRMLVVRAKLPALAAEQQAAGKAVEFGPWYMAGPMKGEKYTDKGLVDKPIDLTAPDNSGQALWQKGEDIKDGQIYQMRFDTGRVEPVYLYRRIKADQAVNLLASFGSSKALEVWLNGQRILRSIKERKVEKDQHILELNLRSGGNELVVRIFNWRRSGAFYFSPEAVPALSQWDQIKADFATEAGWMEKDLGLEGCLVYLGQRSSAEVEGKMVEAALAEIEPVGNTLRQEQQKLLDSGKDAADKRWLDLYVQACRLREALDELKAEETRAATLRGAAERLVKSDSTQRQWADGYLGRLEGFEKRLDDLKAALSAEGKVNREKLRSIEEESLELQREVIVKKPPRAQRGPLVLNARQFKKHVDKFNAADAETIVNFVPNALSWDWMKTNAPLFECPDRKFEEIYYFRWWTYRKHIRHTQDGYVVTEFLAPVGHAGKYNTISCALGHHISEGRWLHNQQFMDDYIRFWYRGNNGGPQPHFHRYSNWVTYAAYNRYLVNRDKDFIVDLVDDFVADFENWQKERGVVTGLFWQYDVLDGGEESISGSRHERNVRPPLSSYMYGSALATAKVAELAGRSDLARKSWNRAIRIKSLIQNLMWDGQAEFFKARLEAGGLCDAREAIGFIPWYFNLPDAGYEAAWSQIRDPMGFQAPMGLTTAERRHPAFRSNGVGTCEWDGAVWPFATTQTLAALANVLRNYEQSYVTKNDYFDALLTYAKSHDRDGRCYVGEYLDEMTGEWLTPDSDRSRFYNHAGFCDLVITGLAGFVPHADDVIEVEPLVPNDTWDWFCLDNVLYHGRIITVLWDRTGEKYGKGKGLQVFADGKEIARSDKLKRARARLP